MKNAEQYLAKLMKAMQDFQARQFTSTEDRNAALTELLNLPAKIMEETHQNCVTTPNYWECDCEDKYLHDKDENEMCFKCNSNEEDQADARLHDVLHNMINGEYLAD